MKKPSSVIYFNVILRTLIWVSALGVGIFFFIQQYLGITLNANLFTYVLMLILLGILYQLTKPVVHPVEQRLRLIAVFANLLFFVQRLYTLIPFPFFFGWLNSEMVGRRLLSVSELNWGIFQFILIMLCYGLGLHWAGKKAPGFEVEESKVGIYHRNRKMILLLSFLLMILSLALGIILGWKMGESWENGWIVRLLPTAILSNMIFFLYIDNPNRLDKWDKILFWLTIGGSVSFAVSQGSKGGIFSVAIMFILLMVLRHGNFGLPKKTVVMGVLFFMVVSPIFWTIGQSIRGTHPLQGAFLVLGISGRLANSTDNFFIFMNDWYDPQYATNVNWINIIGTSLDGVLPGTYFQTAYENLGAYHKTLVWGEISDRIHAENWNSYAQIYLMYGYIGMYLFIIFWAVLTFKVLAACLKRNSFLSRIVAVQFFALMVITFFDGHNLDGLFHEFFYSSCYIIAINLMFLVVDGATSNALRAVPWDRKVALS